jgi:hypothetical protein
MLSPDKQQLLEMAAVVALRRIQDKDKEIMRLEKYLEHEQMSNLSELTNELVELKAQLAIRDKEIEDLMIQVDQERSKSLSVLEKFKTE